MNRFTSSVPIVLAFGALSAAAFGADAAPRAATAAHAASASTALPAVKAVPSRATTAAGKAASGSTDPTVRKLVCLNMSLRCFALKTPPSDGTSKAAPLDLRAPDIHRIVPEVQLREPLAEPQEAEELQEQVQVQGSRPEIDLPIGIASLPWAVMHPTQAWRIFLPVPSGSAK
jgi:hypothetical protein